MSVASTYFNPAANAGALTVLKWAAGTNKSAAGPVNLGQFNVGDLSPPVLSWTVTNVGQGTLTLSNLTLPTGVTLVSGFSMTSLAANASATFAIQISVANSVTLSGNLQFMTNDPTAPTVTIPITGVVQ